MKKTLVLYFLSLIILVTHVMPMYQAIFEGTCEISLINDIGEEDENHKKGKESAEDKELKILFNPIAGLFDGLEKNKSISYYSKSYDSFYQQLTSPPPEQFI